MSSSTAQVIYLNDAATSWPKAPGVVDALRRHTEEAPRHPGRASGFDHDPVAECRRLLASLLAIADPSRVVLAPSATLALNQAILGVGLRPGDRVVTTATEHNSVLRPLNHLSENLGIIVDLIEVDGSGELDRDAFERSLDHDPKLVAINHVSNVTGRANDIEPLFASAKAHGAITLLDASQSIGHIDVHPCELNADMVAFTGHKGLRGPLGTGGLYVCPDIELEQALVGGTGVRSESRLHPRDMPIRLEAGTLNTPAFAGLAEALKWRAGNGYEHTQAAEANAEALRGRLGDVPGIRLYGCGASSRRTGIVSFQIDGWSVSEAGQALTESFGVICRTGLHCAPLVHRCLGSAPQGTIRFSASGFNSAEDIDAAVRAVEALAV